MYRWYAYAKTCYAYLWDVSIERNSGTSIEAKMRRSRWFTRGWTLQELIAPSDVYFYSLEWSRIGRKFDQARLISSITGISEGVLKDPSKLESVSVARKMSWASKRRTTRVEDIAYCLFGLFDVNMPLIYGEGTKAFQRLQEAIMSSTNDQSLFAWGTIVGRPGEWVDRPKGSGIGTVPWKLPRDRLPLMGLFARSPLDFQHSEDILPVDHSYTHHHNRRNPPVIINKGVLVSLVSLETFPSVSYWENPPISQYTEREMACLLCHHRGSRSTRLVALILQPWGDDYYSRTNELLLIDTYISQTYFEQRARQRHILPYQPFELRNADILLWRWDTPKEPDWRKSTHTPSGPAWHLMCGKKVLRIEYDAQGDEEESFMYKTGEKKGFAVTLRRVRQGSTRDLGDLMVGVSPMEKKKDKKAWASVKGPPTPGDQWVASHGKHFDTPAFSRVLRQPSDTWTLDVDGLPRVQVECSRKKLYGRGEVDVIDLYMRAN